MIEDVPNYWGTPLSDEFNRTITPLVAEQCLIPHCPHKVIWGEYCDQHLVQINDAYEEWQNWKYQTDLDNYFIPYEQLSE